jgi:hypothetical protein
MSNRTYYIFKDLPTIQATNGDPGMMSIMCERTAPSIQDALGCMRELIVSNPVKYADIELAYYDYSTCESRMSSFVI